MNNAETLKKVYRLLSDIFGKGAFANILLNTAETIEDDERAYVTRLVTGVVERSEEFDYIISALTEKIKPSVAVLIKIGLYQLKYMDIPDYAAINNTVELAKLLGKSGISGFVNAVLRKSATVRYPDKKDREKYLSVTCSLPLWIVKRLTRDYGADRAESILSALTESEKRIHVRPNIRKIETVKFEELLDFSIDKRSNLGYYVTHSTLKKLNSDTKNGSFFVHNEGSMLVCAVIEAYTDNPVAILDTCAAPGGKSVLLSELYPEAEITACDIYPHRAALIESYAARAGARNVRVEVRDATVVREFDREIFDVVLCDVPCSGLGVLSSRPDIRLNRKAESISALAALQYKILSASAECVKPGGLLVYSTCTVFDEENSAVVNKLLANNPEYEKLKIELPLPFADIDGCAQLLPDIGGTDGFFIAALRRKL
ncbi:MAG: 16S rRNA (cytosine(967)-C(5))-methyltransferase RsmB [Clostridiales bacterium]|nr:16S rRNA (cytosine(967)-C(5))-methyltransferase RsmB [Clostridiales bacterium]